MAGELVSPAGSLRHKIPGFQCRAAPLITMLSNLMHLLFLISCHNIGRLGLAFDFALSKPQIFFNFPINLLVLCTQSKPCQRVPVVLTWEMLVTNASWH